MRAAFLTGIKQVEIRETSQPEITDPRSVLLRIGTVGVCGSDVHYYTAGRIGSLVVTVSGMDWSRMCGNHRGSWGPSETAQGW